MKITVLGTGTPTPSLERQSSGYLVEVGQDVIVLDHGPGAHHRLLQTGRKAVEVTHAFFTHLHYDHCIEYPRLVLQRWDQGGGAIPDLQVFGPPPIARMTESLFGEGGAFWPDMVARTENPCSLEIYKARGGTLPRKKPAPQVREVAPGDVVEGSGWRVIVGEGWHFQPQLECLAFRIDAPEGSLCYSGDSGGVYEPMIALAKGCDVLIHMTHLEAGTEPTADFRARCGAHTDVAEVARRAGVRTLVTTHMLEHIDRPGIRERLIREMAEIFDGTIIWGRDLMEVPLRTERSTRID